MSWNQRLEIMSSNVWGKENEGSEILPEDAVVLCAYQLLVQGIMDIDQIAFIRQTVNGDELWMITEETPGENTGSATVGKKTNLDTFFRGQPKHAMRVLTMNHTDSVFRSGVFLLSEYFNAVCGFYAPVKFLAEERIQRSDYEGIIQLQKDTIRKNQTAARNRRTKIIEVAAGLGLHPQAPLLNEKIWSARCPGTSHQLSINASKNEFGCGYCGVKGDHEKLREFVNYREKELAVKLLYPR
jgi:hypothetical protein